VGKPTIISQSGHAMGGNGGLVIFYLMPLGMVENFTFHLFKPLGWFFLVVILGIVHKVNHCTK